MVFHVSGVPLAQHAHGYWIVVAIVLTFTAIAGWAVSGAGPIAEAAQPRAAVRK